MKKVTLGAAAAVACLVSTVRPPTIPAHYGGYSVIGKETVDGPSSHALIRAPLLRARYKCSARRTVLRLFTLLLAGKQLQGVGQ